MELEDRCFTKIDVDACVYLNTGIVLLVYVDDCIIFSSDKVNVTKFIESLRTDFYLTYDVTIENYLGVKLVKYENGEITLSQTFLIKRIIQLLNFSTMNLLSNPFRKPLLFKDVKEEDFFHTW